MSQKMWVQSAAPHNCLQVHIEGISYPCLNPVGFYTKKLMNYKYTFKYFAL